ncbi:hypothetical protein E4U28_005826 [Claviceps purpurea]|nr:hypothetical protein E4U28_005826 [Claviceps purpurea]
MEVTPASRDNVADENRVADANSRTRSTTTDINKSSGDAYRDGEDNVGLQRPDCQGHSQEAEGLRQICPPHYRSRWYRSGEQTVP